MAKASRELLKLAVGVAVGMVVGLRLVSVRGVRALSPEEARFFLIALVVAVPVVTLALFACLLVPVAIHELGHYLAGRAVGFRFVTGVVGPFGLREERGRKVAFRARPALFGGYVAMVPPDERDVLKRYAWFVLGGPIASLLWLALVLIAWWLSGVPFSTQVVRGAGTAGLWQLAFLGAAFFGVLILPGTLFPRRLKTLGGMPTDMMRLLILRKGGAEAEAMFALLELNRLLLEGVPAERLPERLLAAAEGHPKEDAQRLAALQIRWAAEIERDPDRAEALVAEIGRLSAKLGPSVPAVWKESVNLIHAEQAAFVRKDADAAEAFLKTIEPTLPTHRLSKATVEAAVAAIRKDPELPSRLDTAEATLAEVAKKTRQNLDFERRWLAAMREGWPHVETLKSTASA